MFCATGTQRFKINFLWCFFCSCDILLWYSVGAQTLRWNVGTATTGFLPQFHNYRMCCVWYNPVVYIYISQNTAQVSEDWNGASKISHEKKNVGVEAHRAPAYGILSQWLRICANDAYSSIHMFNLSQKQWLQYISPHPSNNQRLSFEEQPSVQLCPDFWCIPGRIKAIWIERY